MSGWATDKYSRQSTSRRSTSRQSTSPHLVTNTADPSFYDVEAGANPIWRPGVPMDTQVGASDALREYVFTSGLMYVPHLRHLHELALAQYEQRFASESNQQGTSARLWKMQLLLCILYSREAKDPTRNFVTLGQAVSTARLLGLHKDSSGWDIPYWEKSLRARLWWSLLLYDRL